MLEEIQKYKKYINFEPIVHLQQKQNQLKLFNTCSTIEVVDQNIEVKTVSNQNLIEKYVETTQKTEDLIVIRN